MTRRHIKTSFLLQLPQIHSTLTCTATSQAALVGVLLITLGVAAILVGAALAAQRPLQGGVTLPTLVQADSSMQHLLDDCHVVALGIAAVGKGGGAVLSAVGAVGEPLVRAGRAL